MNLCYKENSLVLVNSVVCSEKAYAKLYKRKMKREIIPTHTTEDPANSNQQSDTTAFLKREVRHKDALPGE